MLKIRNEKINSRQQQITTTELQAYLRQAHIEYGGDS